MTATPSEAPTLPAPPPKLFRAIVPPLVLPIFLSSADSTVVATALPAIAASFGDVERLSWVIVVNLIAATIAAPVYGRLGDTFGRKRMLFIALSIFLLSAVFSASAPTFGMLLAARALQGMGAGGLMTLAQAVIGENVPKRQIGTYQGYLSANIVAGTTIGPVIGGFLTQLFGWRAIFWGYVPVCALALLLATRLPAGRRGGGRLRFDVAGLALLTSFVVPLMLTVSQLQSLRGVTIGELAVLSAAMLGALLWHQGWTLSPLLPLPLYRNPSFWRSSVMAACSGASLTGMVTFLPIYLQIVGGVSAGHSGLLLIPLTGAISVGSMLTGWLISHSQRTATWPTIGLTITASTLVCLAIWGPSLSTTAISWILAIGGMTQGSAQVTAQITAQSVAGQRQLGAAAATIQLSRSLGSAFGAATTGAVLFGLLSMMDHDTLDLFADLIRHGPGGMATLDPTRRIVVETEMGDAFRGVFLTVACFSGAIVAAAATIPMRRL